MTVSELLNSKIFPIVNEGNNIDTEITKPFACDLLSIAMSKASAGCAWVTVMGNINTIAVALLTETACIILAENTELDAQALEKAKQQGITVLKSDEPVFESALKIYDLINA